VAVIKSYTDIEQSRKLSEFLSHESADMFIADVISPKDQAHSYNFHVLATWGCKTFAEIKERESKYAKFIPCWSLTALLEVLPNENMLVKTTDKEYYCLAKDIMTKHYNNPIDACYEMVLELKRKELL